MNKKISIGATITLIAITAAITFVLTTSFSLDKFNESVADVKERAETYKKLDSISSLISQHALNEPDSNILLDVLSNGYVGTLNDKYARYLTAEEYLKEKQQNNGINVGIGITVSKDEGGYIFINTVMANSPASEAGLKSGELIVSVDGKSLLTEGYANSVAAISGDVGTSVILTVRDQGEDREIAVTRREIEVVSVSVKMIDNIGYIKITEFNSKTLTQFEQALKAVRNSAGEGIIFDLRDNSGGLLSPTLEMLDMLLPNGTIATATYKGDEVKILGTSDNEEIALPMTIIVNQNTASAAELFSAALRDYDKATLVGTTTYGKGVMQETYELSDGSAIVFTTAKFKTIKTPNFDGIGLKPDYEVSLNNGTEASNPLTNEADTQFRKAIEVTLAKIG